MLRIRINNAKDMQKTCPYIEFKMQNKQKTC